MFFTKTKNYVTIKKMSTPIATGTKDVHATENVDKELNRLSGSYYIFLIVMVIVFLALTVMFSVNAYYFGRINSAVPSNGSVTIPGGLSKTDVEALFYTNIVFAGISGIIFLALIIVLIIGIWKPKQVEKIRATTARYTNVVGTNLAAGTREAGAAVKNVATPVGQGLYTGARQVGQGLYTGAQEVGLGAARTGIALGTGTNIAA